LSRRALICSYGPPRYDRDSGSRRLWHFIQFLRDEGWTISFVAANTLESGSRYTRELNRLGIPVYDGPTARVEDVIERGRFELALCAFWQVGELYVPLIREFSPDTCVAVDSVDLEFVREARRIFSRTRPDGKLRLLDHGYAARVAAELNVYAAADRVLAVSPDEADLVNRLVGEPGLACCVPDAEELSPSPVAAPSRRGIVFVGSFRHLPNVDALEYFCQDILPLIPGPLLERHPLSIVGDGLEEALPQAARGLPNVHLVGWTPSLLPYLERARVSVVPLRYGAGTKRKVIQALLVGTPTVTTSIGAEGLAIVSGDHLMVADDPSSFAEAVARLIEDDALWRRLSERGRSHLAPRHGRESVRAGFLSAIESAIEHPRKSSLLPPTGRAQFERRTRHQWYQKLVPELQEFMSTIVPLESEVLVLSEGNVDLLQLKCRDARHFPPLRPDGSQTEPTDSRQAIELLEQEIDLGADFLIVPNVMPWWLSGYPDLTNLLASRCSEYRTSTCTIFDLREIAAERRRPTLPEAVVPVSEGPQLQTRRDKLPPRLIAFYLPQFHPILENDEWWGEGFTEWTNVANAEPLFTGHYQPHLPADLGFYDLRVAETRQAQADLAREAGIHAFCYYHYWFNGKLLLERPFNEVLESGRPDFPFCLCWANEHWSRRWDGRGEDVLQPQSYGEQDDVEHIRWLMPALADPRAVKVNGKPVFIVYQARELPDPARTADAWRRELREAGLPDLYLVAVETGWDAGWDATQLGFDAKVLFQPQFSILQTVPQAAVDGPEGLRVFDYNEAWPALSKPEPVAYRRYETVCSGWDNSTRTGTRGWLLHNATPEAYESWLGQAVSRSRDLPPGERLVFLNAWNEWAEGAHLEPDLRHGGTYLEATRRALWSAGQQEAGGDAAQSQPSRTRIEVADGGTDVGAASPNVELPRARALAFYLPQFYPIPENDEWWGKGFTEWTNVVAARPLFPGHSQPHQPANLGFYDLRVPETRERQAELARLHGIEAFCYWHYWFLGRRLLERPFQEVLASNRPDYPFCLAWANEPWSRRWLGEEQEILMRQEYSPEDDLEHARWLLAAFSDHRYLRLDGRPLFLVYRPTHLPEPRRTAELFRTVCVEAGLPEPFLLGVNAFQDIDYRTLGFDGTLDFEPRLGALGNPRQDGLKVYDYAEARRRMRRERSFPVYPSIVVSWDNSPRRGKHGVVLTNSHPDAFEAGLREMAASLLARPLEDRLLFINGWNEWAEGNHLEPDQRYGLGHLQAVHRVILGESAALSNVVSRPCGVSGQAEILEAAR
jgi:lipopolysaccharide biosynthesis protein/glycosyltransferase involved in cell wall biosynthesis